MPRRAKQQACMLNTGWRSPQAGHMKKTTQSEMHSHVTCVNGGKQDRTACGAPSPPRCNAHATCNAQHAADLCGCNGGSNPDTTLPHSRHLKGVCASWVHHLIHGTTPPAVCPNPGLIVCLGLHRPCRSTPPVEKAVCWLARERTYTGLARLMLVPSCVGGSNPDTLHCPTA